MPRRPRAPRAGAVQRQHSLRRIRRNRGKLGHLDLGTASADSSGSAKRLAQSDLELRPDRPDRVGEVQAERSPS